MKFKLPAEILASFLPLVVRTIDTQAFAPVTFSSSTTSTMTLSYSDKLIAMTTLFTATNTESLSSEDMARAVSSKQVGSNLGLKYTPIVPFGKNAPIFEGKSDDAKKILGGKGANLSEMSQIGLSVPPGFTITTECCDKYCFDEEWDKSLPEPLWNSIIDSLEEVQKEMQSVFGSPENPLLLSVRSGAAISMPGMMDTVLNLGMNDNVVEGLAKKTKNPRFAWDSYRRFLEMFGNVVLEIPRSEFEDELDDLKYEKNAYEDSYLSAEDLQELVVRFKSVFEKMDLSFPQDVREQLKLAST